MIVGIGVDTVDVPRFTRSLERTPRLAERVLTDAERAMPIASQAARFAAREAAVKALGGLHGLELVDFEVTRSVGERPSFVARPALDAVLARLGVDHLHLSLTHDGGLATAFVIAEGPRAS